LGLSLLFKSISKFPFIERLSKGDTLLVGEGNFSFCLSLVTKITNPEKIIATTIEKDHQISEETEINIKYLKKLGTKIYFEVDATSLNDFFKENKFDHIIFQFPHSGTRESVEDHNSNFILLRDFLISAIKRIKPTGSVVISCVDNDFYNNIFQFDEMANILNIQKPLKYIFDPNDFPGYTNTMTHQEGSALENHDKFATWEFRL
jgi:hypothetical protein